MDFAPNQKQISSEEKAQINRAVKEELIEHLYQGCLPGTITGVPAGMVVFADFYGYTPMLALYLWFAYYLSALLLLSGLYFFYKRYKEKFSQNTWLISYSAVMSTCASAWAISVFLIPTNLTHEYLAFIALFLITTSYVMGSIGVFELCLLTLGIIMTPLIVSCFIKGGFINNLVGSYSIIYTLFMISINRRSTKWFKDSLILKLENTLVSFQANHDLLTGLPNQRLLPQYVESLINQVKGTEKTFALICYSLNRMEIINDSLGHQAGDAVIQVVTNRLAALFKKNAANESKTQYVLTISRKDTLNILAYPVTPQHAEEDFKLLFTVLDEPVYLEQKALKITASIGVSFYGKDGADTTSLLISADAAMLRAKQLGGNHIEFYRAEINAAMPKQIEIENDLYIALKENQLMLFYQPLIDLRTDDICGMEALMRWNHPKHGFISPINFIPLAEETGLIVPMGEWALKEACRQTRIWHQMGFNQLKVAVNLAEKQLFVKDFVEHVAGIIKASDFDSRFLELELTETAMLDESVVHIMDGFKKMGLSLAVDDFGTGYSGLSYLRRFSVDKLKIDQSFIRDIPKDTDSMTIVSAIIAMGKELGIKTLAEGVETIEQLEFLRSKGCNYIQGYYFSKPLDADLFTQLLYKYKSNAEKRKQEPVS